MAGGGGRRWPLPARPAGAAAFQIDLGNPDAVLRFDNTVRYNAGWRMEKRDRRWPTPGACRAGEYKFDRGELITNRIDLLTEFDFVYAEPRFPGLRGELVRRRLRRQVKGNPAYQAAGLGTAYPNNSYTPAVARYYLHSAEFLDAFVFGRVSLGADMPLDASSAATP